MVYKLSDKLVLVLLGLFFSPTMRPTAAEILELVKAYVNQ